MGKKTVDRTLKMLEVMGLHAIQKPDIHTLQRVAASISMRTCLCAWAGNATAHTIHLAAGGTAQVQQC